MLVQVFDGAAYVARRRSAPNDPAWREHSAGAGVAQPAGHGSSGDDDQRRGCGILDALAEDVDQYRHGEDRSAPRRVRRRRRSPDRTGWRAARLVRVAVGGLDGPALARPHRDASFDDVETSWAPKCCTRLAPMPPTSPTSTRRDPASKLTHKRGLSGSDAITFAKAATERRGAAPRGESHLSQHARLPRR